MIQIYSPDNTDLTSNGDMVLMPTEAYVHAILNSTWEASLTQPIDDDGRWKYVIEDAVVKMPSFNGDQLFRIKKTVKSDTGVIATMEPIFFDAKDDCFLVDVRPTDKSGQEALDIMCAANEDGKYSGSSDIATQLTAYYEYKNLLEAISGDIDQSFLNRWGGEILYDNFTIIINTQVGEDNNVELLYGKNIPKDGMSIEVDTSSVITRLYPQAYNGRTMESAAYVDSSLIGEYPVVKAALITFDYIKLIDDCSTTEDDEGNEVVSEDDDIIVCETQEELDEALIAACEGQFEDGIDKPTVTISADMVLLQNTEQYKDFSVLETVSLGDTIHCKNSHLDIETDARVIELEYDSLTEKISSVVIGDLTSDYFQSTATTVSSLTTTMTELQTNASEFNTVVTKYLFAMEASIEDLQATMVTTDVLEAEYASIAYIESNYMLATEINAMIAELDELYATTATVESLLAGYAEIDFANVDIANIVTGFVSDLLIAQGFLSTSATVGTLSVTEYLTGVGIIADYITAGTLNCANITVSNLSVGSLTVDSINGYTLAGSTVSADDLEDLLTQIMDAVNTNDDEVNDIQDSLSTVTSIANGKSTTYFSDSAPSSTYFDLQEDDVWFDTDGDNAMYMYDGSEWVLCQFSTGALAASSITASLIASSAVTAAKIAAGAITTEKLAAESVTAAKIATASITATQIASSTITGDNIAAETITGSLIAAATITGDHLVSGTITATQIAAGTITSNEIDVSSITAAILTAGVITADMISSGAVTADKISVSDLSALSATIGGFTIGSTSIYSLADAYGTTSSNIYIGSSGISLGTAFKVSYAGALTATSGTIGAITIRSTGLYSYNSSVTSSYSGIYKPSTISSSSIAFYAGASSYTGTGAKFKVTYGGELTASGANIEGSLTISEAEYLLGTDADGNTFPILYVSIVDDSTNDVAVVLGDYEEPLTLYGSSIDINADESISLSGTTYITSSLYLTGSLYVNSVKALYLYNSTYLYVGNSSYPFYLEASYVYAPKFVQCGRVTITPSAANTPTSATVTFPDGSFAGQPRVAIAPVTTVPGTAVLGCGVSSVSKSGFTMYVTRTNTTSTSIEWIAIYQPS